MKGVIIQMLQIQIFLATTCLMSFGQVTNILPLPASIKTSSGQFKLDQSTVVSVGNSNKELGTYLSTEIQSLTGFSLALAATGNKQIKLHLQPDNSLGMEGYRLQIDEQTVSITAATNAGIFYGMQSLLQCLPAVRTNEEIRIPAMDIVDFPRFKWRGMMLDVGRHFFSTEFIKEWLDLMARYKMNTFHWHLTEDQGWRIEIKKYPKLTEIGAFRNGTTIGRNAGNDKKRYGGYYTQEQIKEIVAYASARQITIVPEIEMPGHSSAAIAAYPELSCFPEENTATSSINWNGPSTGKQVQQTWGVFDDVFCPTENTFRFLQDVLDEVVALFPGQYIHIGGDECPKENWKRSAFCQKLIKEQGLKDEHELQSYFIQRIEKYLNSKGKKIIGWDEILEGGLAANASVMSWRGEAGGIQACKQHHNVVMTPGNPVYFDHYQGDPETEPLAIGGFNTLKSVYRYEPIPKELTPAEASYILGAQANLWTEYIASVEHAEYMILPRMLALSEVLWSPKEQRNWVNFSERLATHYNYFSQRGFNFSYGNFKVDFKPISTNDSLLVKLETEDDTLPIYYSIDGTTPSESSGMRYQGPIRITGNTTISAMAKSPVSGARVMPSTQSFAVHKALGKAVRYETPNNRHYPANGSLTLVDGIRGGKDHSKYWHAFNQDDMVVTISLGGKTSIKSISLTSLQNPGAWIFLPVSVKFEVSDDGKKFTEITTVLNQELSKTSEVIKEFKASFEVRKAKFVRVTAYNIRTCPAGHPGTGQGAWLFVDEIVVD